MGLLLAYFSVSLDWFFPVNDDSFVLYSAIFDAGSTGSRARVFTVLQNATGTSIVSLLLVLTQLVVLLHFDIKIHKIGPSQFQPGVAVR